MKWKYTNIRIENAHCKKLVIFRANSIIRHCQYICCQNLLESILDGTELRMMCTFTFMYEQLFIIQCSVISFADLLSIDFFSSINSFPNWRIVSVFICEAFHHIILRRISIWAAIHHSITFILNDSDMNEICLAVYLITTILVVRGWRGPLYSQLNWLNYGFAFDNYHRHIQSLNRRNMNLTLESHLIRTEFQLRNNSFINDYQFMDYMYGCMVYGPTIIIIEFEAIVINKITYGFKQKEKQEFIQRQLIQSLF